MEVPKNPGTWTVPCRYLRAKEMYYGAADDDACASGSFWCQKTHETFGPDGEPVEKKRCCDGRSCYLS
jgi:hypothetical protein